MDYQTARLKEKSTKFSDLLRNSDTANNPEFTVLRKGLLKDLKQTDKDISGLRHSIDLVSKSRAKFPLITDAELAGRREFVMSSAAAVAEVRAKIDSESARDKMAQDELHAKASYEMTDIATSQSNDRGGSAQKENSRFIKNQVAEQRYMLNEQDNALDTLGDAVDRLDHLGREVNTELKEQNLMLNELDDELDAAGNRMNVVQAQLAKLLKTKDGCTIWTIVILTVLFLLLLGLVVYT